MKSSAGLRKIVFGTFVLVLSLGFYFTETNGQTRKKAKVRKTVAIVQPTPVPSTNPEIISRAEDYQNESQIISTPAENSDNTTPIAETYDEKLLKANNRIKELTTRIKNLEASKTNPYDEKQKRLLMNLDILSRAEQRSETLRKQLFDMIEKENQIKTKLDQIESDIRPEMIDRSVAFAGSLRPEEIRDMRKKSLDSEKRNLQDLLAEIQNTKSSLELNVQKSDQLVEKLRFKLEKEIDDALSEEENQ